MQKRIFGKTKVTVTVKLGDFFIRSVFLRLAPTVGKEVLLIVQTQADKQYSDFIIMCKIFFISLKSLQVLTNADQRS